MSRCQGRWVRAQAEQPRTTDSSQSDFCPLLASLILPAPASHSHQRGHDTSWHTIQESFVRIRYLSFGIILYFVNRFENINLNYSSRAYSRARSIGMARPSSQYREKTSSPRAARVAATSCS